MGHLGITEARWDSYHDITIRQVSIGEVLVRDTAMTSEDSACVTTGLLGQPVDCCLNNTRTHLSGFGQKLNPKSQHRHCSSFSRSLYHIGYHKGRSQSCRVWE